MEIIFVQSVSNFYNVIYRHTFAQLLKYNFIFKIFNSFFQFASCIMTKPKISIQFAVFQLFYKIVFYAQNSIHILKNLNVRLFFCVSCVIFFHFQVYCSFSAHMIRLVFENTKQIKQQFITFRSHHLYSNFIPHERGYILLWLCRIII